MPSYSPELIEHGVVITGDEGDNEGLQVLHTPGHTPDSLSLWEADTRGLFVGDTVYEREPIIFPPQGNIVQWFATMDYLIQFVHEKNEEDVNSRVLLHAGHCTSGADALDVLEQGKFFIGCAVKGSIKPTNKCTVDGVTIVSYQRSDKRFALRCPERLVLEARKRTGPSEQ